MGLDSGYATRAFAPSGALARSTTIPRAQEDWVHYDESSSDWREHPKSGGLLARMDDASYARLRTFLDSQEHVGTHGAKAALSRDRYGMNMEAEVQALLQARSDTISAGGLAAQAGRKRRGAEGG